LVEESGQIIKVQPDGVIVAVVQTSACQSCKAKQGCGQAVLSEWGSPERQDAKNHFFIANARITLNRALNPGDTVRLGIREDTLSRAAVWMYLWPLLPAFLALWAGSALALAEPAQLLAAAAAGGAAVGVTRLRFAGAGTDWSPRILAVEASSVVVIARDAG
jgi:sigma-E factor negative regulatory protein RseC